MAEILTRRNTVLEALRGNRRQIYRLWLQRGVEPKATADILAAARKRNVPLELIDKQQLSRMAQDSRHQGVVLEVGPYVYSDVDSMMALAAERGEPPFLLLLDLLQGPQNIGSLLRSAEVFGVHGVILQDRRAPDITATVVQYSAGATEHLLIAQVTNLAQTIQRLQQDNLWVAGLDLSSEAVEIDQVDLNIPLAIVVGHEGSGLRRLVRQRCDMLLKLPMRGHVESLNAAVAGSIALYAAWRARDSAVRANSSAGDSA